MKIRSPQGAEVNQSRKDYSNYANHRIIVEQN